MGIGVQVAGLVYQFPGFIFFAHGPQGGSHVVINVQERGVPDKTPAPVHVFLEQFGIGGLIGNIQVWFDTSNKISKLTLIKSLVKTARSAKGSPKKVKKKGVITIED